MANYISFQPQDYFSSLLYSYGSPPNAITGVGFSPNALTIKSVSGTSGANNWYWGNTVMGNTKSLSSNNTGGETTSTDSVTSYDADGFTLGADATNNINKTGTNYVSYNWKAETTTGLSGGTITPTGYSFNTTATQSIITWTGTGSNGTIPHGLGAKPDLIIIKRTDGAENWPVYSSFLGATKHLLLNTTGASATNSGIFNDTEPTTSLFTVGTASDVNASGYEYVAWCFAKSKGYMHSGMYPGNSSTNGAFVYTGFRPAFVMVKGNTAEAWRSWDDKREGFNETNDSLSPNNSWAEATGGTAQGINILSNGFKLTSSNSEVNTSVDYYFFAWSAFPLISSNDVSGVAR